MRALVQRVLSASVTVESQVAGKIGAGLLVYVGVAATDTQEHAAYLESKILNLRVFADAEGKINRSVLDTRGELLLISAFSLYADARKGRRPSFSQAAPPELADQLFSDLVERISASGLRVETGRFRAHMHVASVNDGPICVPLDSSRLF